MAHPFQRNNDEIPQSVMVVQEDIKKGDAPTNEAYVSLIFEDGTILKYRVKFKE